MRCATRRGSGFGKCRCGSPHPRRIPRIDSATEITEVHGEEERFACPRISRISRMIDWSLSLGPWSLIEHWSLDLFKIKSVPFRLSFSIPLTPLAFPFFVALGSLTRYGCTVIAGRGRSWHSSNDISGIPVPHQRGLACATTSSSARGFYWLLTLPEGLQPLPHLAICPVDLSEASRSGSLATEARSSDRHQALLLEANLSRFSGPVVLEWWDLDIWVWVAAMAARSL
jgi:hypothetical protein